MTDVRPAPGRIGRRYLRRGVYVSCSAFLAITIALSVSLAISFDGKCGGFFPGLSARRVCSLWDYATGDMLVIAMILTAAYWPVLLTLLVLPPLAGHLYDRRQSRHAD